MPPDPTARYRFEYRIAEGAATFTRRLTGGRTGLFIAFREDGSVRRVYLARAGEELSASRKERLTGMYDSWFLYNPFHNSPGSFVEWLGLPLDVMARWLDAPVEMADLVDVRGSSDLKRWPENWRVIVG